MVPAMRPTHRLPAPVLADRLPDGQSPRDVAPAVVRPSCWWALLVGAPPLLTA
jgi:hypothetical protein